VQSDECDLPTMQVCRNADIDQFHVEAFEKSISLVRIRAFGVRIAMDDFGTAYSSLSYLRSFPFDKIKIDRSFIQNLSSAGDTSAIVRTITRLAKDLGMSTTAEGVETQEDLDFLRENGCTEIQGYLISAAAPARAIPELLMKFGGHNSGETQAA
jgi:EAL domain-containing protein (putative c-di-GMP-specific phosphodiesterase class I)